MSKVPQHILGTAWLAGVVGSVQSLVTAILTGIVIVTYPSCLNRNTSTGSGFFMDTLITQYLKDSKCLAETDIKDGIMESSQVYIWMAIVLSFACLWLIVSVALLTVTDEKDERTMKAFQPVAICWSATTLAVVVIDVTLAAYFAMDLANLNATLRTLPAGDPLAYGLDMVRISAFTLMTLSFKGYVLPIANVVLAIFLIIYGIEMSKILATSEHSMHSQSVLMAYSSNNKNGPWRLHSNNDSMMFERNSSVNPVFVGDKSLTRSWQDDGSAPRRDLPSKSYDRSDSWHHSRAGPDSGGARPFSYLDAPPPPPPAPPMQSSWRRNDTWQNGPPLPDPDYSPLAGRKLKPVLKHNY